VPQITQTAIHAIQALRRVTGLTTRLPRRRRRHVERERRAFLHRAEHDRRARRAHALDAAEPRLEQLAEVLRVAGANLDQEAVVAGDVMNLEHLRRLGELPANPVLTGDFGRADRDERQHPQVGRPRVDLGGIALDDAARFELPHPLQHRRRREADFPGDFHLVMRPWPCRRPRIRRSMASMVI
jgi:hypothetical protein